jgi:hypothetical protein
MMMMKTGLHLGLYRKAMTWGGSALTMLVFLLFVGTHDAQAQNLLQGNAALAALKPVYSQVSHNNCMAAVPPGTPDQVMQQARSLRCEFYNRVYTKLSRTLATSTPATESVLSTTYNEMLVIHPNADAALTLLRNEVRNVMKP